MKKEDFWIFCMGWFATNTPLMVDLLRAMAPVLELCLFGYALYLVANRDKRNGHD